MFNIIFAIYLPLINLVAFLCYVRDKKRGQQRESRLTERGLFFLAAIFGSVGAIVAMELFRHKCDKNNGHALFWQGVPLLFALQCAMIYFWDDYRKTLYYMVPFAAYWLIVVIISLTHQSEHAKEKRAQRLVS